MTTTLIQTDYEAARHAMVASQLRTTNVSDQRVVMAMATIPREKFVPAAVRDLAYLDRAIPLGHGRYANLPMATGRLLTEADLEPTDRVLLIGAAGGYTAAVLATIVSHVVAVESAPELLAIAREAVGNANVRLVEAPLPQGCPDEAPYDVLVVDGAVEHLPDGLVSQVRNGGRVVTGLIDSGGVARLASGRRTAGFALQPFADSECPRLPGFAVPTGFKF